MRTQQIEKGNGSVVQVPPSKAARKTKAPAAGPLVIPCPEIYVLVVRVQGVTPYVPHRFAEKAIRQQGGHGESLQTLVRQGKYVIEKPPREKDRTKREWWKEALLSAYGYDGPLDPSRVLPKDLGRVIFGLPATQITSALIAACRFSDRTMAGTKGVLEARGEWRDHSQCELLKIEGPAPEPFEAVVRNSNGQPDIRYRLRFFPWSSVIRVQYNAKQINPEGVLFLVQQAGQSVGIGEGRPQSKKSAGMGWGRFAAGGDVRVERVKIEDKVRWV